MAPRTPTVVGSLFRERRQAAGLTQAEVADQAGVSIPTVRSIESGARVRSTSTGAVAGVLGWPRDAFARLAVGVVPEDLANECGEADGSITVDQGLDLVRLACQLMGMPPGGIDLTLRVAKSQVEFPDR